MHNFFLSTTSVLSSWSYNPNKSFAFVTIMIKWIQEIYLLGKYRISFALLQISSEFPSLEAKGSLAEEAGDYMFKY